MGYSKGIDAFGVTHPQAHQGPDGMGPGNADSLIWLYGKDLMNFNLNFLWGHYSHPGVWHRLGESHSHPEEEILIHVGLDADTPHKSERVSRSQWVRRTEIRMYEPTYISAQGFPHLPPNHALGRQTLRFHVVTLTARTIRWKPRDGQKNMYDK
jgi:hypothetical protein